MSSLYPYGNCRILNKKFTLYTVETFIRESDEHPVERDDQFDVVE